MKLLIIFRIVLFHRQIQQNKKIKPEDVKQSAHINFNIQNNDKNRKFKVYDHIKIFKYLNYFAKACTPNC